MVAAGGLRKPFADGPGIAARLRTVEDAPWIRARAEGLLGQWHMPAGEGVGGLLLTACDRTFGGDTDLEQREVRLVPANERCPLCQSVHVAREPNGA